MGLGCLSPAVLRRDPAAHARGHAGAATSDRIPLRARSQAWRLSFRGLGDRQPDVLEIGLRGRRRPRVEAYWDGCVLAL